jgi:hypothetical protein
VVTETLIVSAIELHVANHLPNKLSGFGGLVVSMVASGTRPKPLDFFGQKNPQHALPSEGK